MGGLNLFISSGAKHFNVGLIAALLLTMALVSYHLISTPLASGIWVAAAIYLLLRCLLFRVAPALLLAAATGIWLFWP